MKIKQELEEIKLRIKQAKPPMVFNGNAICPKCKGHPEDYYVPTRGSRWGSVCGGCQGSGVVEIETPAPQWLQLTKDAIWLIEQLEQMMIREEPKLNRYWVSWWTGYYEDEGCTRPPYQVWISGHRGRNNTSKAPDRDEVSLCAVIDALSPYEIWESVAKHFPDFEQRFCELSEKDWQPNGRFPNFENRTSLKE